MAVVCPSITAKDNAQYKEQIEKVAGFAHRLQIDLTDGQFAKGAGVRPEDTWWPVGIKADFHLMYTKPGGAVEIILKHRPHLVIIHAESDENFPSFAEKCRSFDAKIGLALLPETSPDTISDALPDLDHVMIFSGNLGEYGGHADMSLLNKVSELKKLKPELEIGWDGGVNQQNISELILGGVDVLNVGGYLQNAADTEKAYETLSRIAEETGTT